MQRRHESGLRILFLAPDVRLSEQDGQSVHTLDLCRAFCNVGNQVLLLVAETNTPDSLPPGLLLAAIHNKGRRALAESLKAAARFQPDLVFERRASAKLGARVGSVLKIPSFLEVNGLVDAEVTGWLRQLSLTRARLNRSNRICSKVFVPSRGLGEALAKRGWFPKEKIVVVPNGVNLDLFKPIEMRIARDALGIPPDLRIAIYVGKLAAWQGVEVLLNAAALLEKLERFRVIVVGDGPLMPALRSLIRTSGLDDTVLLIGSLPHSQIPTWIAASDLCVAPFTRERNALIELSPLKLYEYLAMGKPIVASDLPGTRSIVRDAGIIVPSDSAADLAAALAGAFSDAIELRAMGARGTKYAIECSWEARAEQILQTVRQYVRTEARVEGRWP